MSDQICTLCLTIVKGTWRMDVAVHMFDVLAVFCCLCPARLPPIGEGTSRMTTLPVQVCSHTTSRLLSALQTTYRTVHYAQACSR